MSSLLFLGFVGGFVLIAYWAFKNDGMATDASGTGLLAMQRLPDVAISSQRLARIVGNEPQRAFAFFRDPKFVIRDVSEGIKSTGFRFASHHRTTNL